MADSSRPFFLFLNFMDAHGPYLPLAGYDRKFSGDRPMPPNKKAVPTTGTDAQRALRQASPAEKPAKQKALDDATRLAQVDERHAAVIAPVGHPPGEGDGLADVLGTEGAGVMGADHCCSWDSGVEPVETTCGRRSSVGGVQVAGSAVTVTWALAWAAARSGLAAAVRPLNTGK